ncbi:hypothetical protein BD309DRAFT_480924 [Dichomitus squalens]|nr:hypothetical protein BD309DRAFT_480924 [Dichomitus squalens]
MLSISRSSLIRSQLLLTSVSGALFLYHQPPFSPPCGPSTPASVKNHALRLLCTPNPTIGHLSTHPGITPRAQGPFIYTPGPLTSMYPARYTYIHTRRSKIAVSHRRNNI